MIFEIIFNDKNFTKECEAKTLIDELITTNSNLVKAEFVPNDAFGKAEPTKDVYKAFVCSCDEKIIHLKIDFSMFERIGFNTVKSINKKLVNYFKSNFQILTAIHYKAPICPHLHILLKSKCVVDSFYLFDETGRRNLVVLLGGILRRANVNVLYFIKQKKFGERIIRAGVVEIASNYLNNCRKDNA